MLFLPIIACTLIFNACTKKDNVPVVVNKPGEDKGWTFSETPVWADEFDTPGKPDPTKWSYETEASGWGNNELQFYTAGENANIASGILTIEARRENRERAQYTSTRMITRNFASWLYGRFEARIKVSGGRGTWPAFWMLPTDNIYGVWPRSGEIDIMEHVGYDANKIHISVHTEAFNHMSNTHKTSITPVPTAVADFHVYRVDWTPYSI